MAQVFVGSIVAKSACSVVARLEDRDGTYLQQADFSAIAYSVFSLASTPPSILATGTFTISTAIFDTLQTPNFWTVDSIGFNFVGDIPSTDLATNVDVRVEVKYTLTTAAIFRVVWEAKHIPIYGS